MWRHFSDGKIVHVFIEARMSCKLYFSCFKIIPENILSGMRNITKEDTLLRVRFELDRTMSRRANPNPTSKGMNIGEAFLLACCQGYRGLSFVVLKKSI